jgi:hypothetical protein
MRNDHLVFKWDIFTYFFADEKIKVINCICHLQVVADF